MFNEASGIIDEGIATIKDVDTAMKLGANHPLGPLKLSDLIGNDITLAILNTLMDNQSISQGLKDKVRFNDFGRKTKKVSMTIENNGVIKIEHIILIINKYQ